MGLLMLMLLPLLAGRLVWKNVDFFLSRSDYYHKSEYELISKRFSMSFGAACTVFILLLFIGSF
jgi:hypothetical protein